MHALRVKVHGRRGDFCFISVAVTVVDKENWNVVDAFALLPPGDKTKNFSLFFFFQSGEFFCACAHFRDHWPSAIAGATDYA